MIYIAIACALTFGTFEACIFRNTQYEEDRILAIGAFIAAGFLILVKVTGVW